MTRPEVPAGFFSVEELLLPPNVMSALRLPLAVIFPFASRSRGTTLAVLAAAGLTDVLDGWLARRNGQVTTTGAVLDPVADKVFAISVVATLIAERRLPRWGIPALLAREILEAPLLAWVLLRRGEGVSEARSNVPGKVATVAQFAAVMAAIEAPAALAPALVCAAVTGTVAGVAYWMRELDRAPPSTAAPAA